MAAPCAASGADAGGQLRGCCHDALAGAGVRQLADGVGMLAEQAAEAFAWWRGVRPDTRAVIGQLTIARV